MQQPGPMFSVMPSFSPTNITTDQIQKYLEENKKLIVAILDNQNLGKLAECAQYQAQLQKNLMYLAAVADAQPQTPATPPQHMQMAPHPAMQQGGFYMQHPQAAAMGQQPGLFPQRPPFNSPHPMQDSRPHPQASQAQMAPRPIGPTNGIHQTHNDTNLGGNKREKTDGGAAAGSDGHGNSGVTHGGGVGEEAK